MSKLDYQTNLIRMIIEKYIILLKLDRTLAYYCVPIKFELLQNYEICNLFIDLNITLTINKRTV